MDELSIFVDESGDKTNRNEYFLLTLVVKQAIVQKRTTMAEYRLAQVADYLCAIELAAAKYEAKENGATYEKFFGSVGAFKKNWLKQARRKLIG